MSTDIFNYYTSSHILLLFLTIELFLFPSFILWELLLFHIDSQYFETINSSSHLLHFILSCVCILIMVLLWPFYPLYWLWLLILALNFSFSLCLAVSVISRYGKSAHTLWGRQEEQDTEATFWSRGNMSAASGEGSIWREMEIGRNMARNTAICSSAGCVRQNGMPEVRLRGGGSAQRIWGNKTWGWCQSWRGRQYFFSLMFRHAQLLKHGSISEILVVKSTGSGKHSISKFHCLLCITLKTWLNLSYLQCEL